MSRFKIDKKEDVGAEPGHVVLGDRELVDNKARTDFKAASHQEPSANSVIH